VSSRPDAHLSTVPSDRTRCHTVRTPNRPSIICPDDVHFCSDLHCFDKLQFQLASIRTSQQPFWTPLSEILSKFNLREDCFNRPDDVDSRPDALLYKARIAIQISPSGCQSALVRTRVQQLRKLRIRLQPSGRLPIMVRTRA